MTIKQQEQRSTKTIQLALGDLYLFKLCCKLNTGSFAGGGMSDKQILLITLKRNPDEFWFFELVCVSKECDTGKILKEYSVGPMWSWTELDIVFGYLVATVIISLEKAYKVCKKFRESDEFKDVPEYPDELGPGGKAERIAYFVAQQENATQKEKEKDPVE